MGVDYAGELQVRDESNGSKVNLLVFTCLTTRAVHLELVNQKGIREFLMALRRMANTRGCPTHLYSDNALTFRGTKELLRPTQGNRPHRLPGTCDEFTHIQWKFSTAAAPHTGGVWERMVQTVKRPLRKVLGRALLDREELLTICKETEGMINDRPLAATSVDSMDVITTSMLMLGRRIRQPTKPEIMPASEPVITNAQEAWVQKQILLDQLWNAWMQQYCLSLQKRSKWEETKPNVEVGDLVIVQQANYKRNHWPLARVTEVNQGSDGLVRSVKITLPKGPGSDVQKTMNRSIHQIIPLEMTYKEENEGN